MDGNLLSDLKLDQLGISRSVDIDWRYFIVLAPLGSDGCSIPVRVDPSKLHLFYRDYPAKDFLVFEVSSSASYRCTCGSSHLIAQLYKAALSPRCNVLAFQL